MYGEQPMPTGTVVAVAQAQQAVAIAEPIAAEPVAVAAVAPSVPNGRDFIPRNQSPPTAGYLFGEGSQGWGYYALESAAEAIIEKLNNFYFISFLNLYSKYFIGKRWV